MSCRKFLDTRYVFSEVAILYLKRICSINNTTYYWWEFSTCRFSKASFLLVTKQPSTGHRSIARPGLDDGPALLSDVQAGGTTTIAAGSSSRIVELGSSICSSSVFHWFHCPYPKRKYRARVHTILMPPTFPIASLNRYTPNFSGVPQKLTWCQQFGLQIFPKWGDADICRLEMAVFRCFFGRNKFSRPNGRLSPIACHTYLESYGT